MLLSGAWGQVIHEKNRKQKILWHFYFKLIMISCKEDYDSWVQGAILAKVGCRPPYWDVRSDYPNCITQQQLKLFGKIYSY
jgi:hypothetical protein